VGDETLEALRADLDTVAERLGDAVYDSLRAQAHKGGKLAKNDPDLMCEKFLSRARNAVERAVLLVAQAERVRETGGVDLADGLD
jgi:hypothetical protein